MMMIIACIVVSFLITWFYKRLAGRKSILDIPNKRSSHTVPVPRGGGISIAITWLAALIYLYLTSAIEKHFFYALLPGFVLALSGMIDDIKTLSAGIRIVIQFLTAITGVWFLGGWQQINFGYENLQAGIILSITGVIFIVFLVNIFNFLDGIDGYLGTETIFIFLSFFFFSGNPNTLIFAGCVAGFLILNWPRARIFCGDTGSTLIGYTVAIFSIYYQNEQILSFPVILIITSLFWFDGSVTIIRRIVRREKLSEAHKNHAYQRLVQGGFSHQKVVLLSVCLNLLLFLMAAVTWYYCKGYQLLSLGTAIIMLIFIYLWVEKVKPFSRAG